MANIVFIGMTATANGKTGQRELKSFARNCIHETIANGYEFDNERVIPLPSVLNRFKFYENERALYQREGDRERAEEMERDVFPKLRKTALAECGYETPYDFQCEEWGSKWGLYDLTEVAVSDTCVEFLANAGWTLPRKLLIALSAKYPHVSFQCSFVQEDLAERLMGKYIYEKGEEIDCEPRGEELWDIIDRISPILDAPTPDESEEYMIDSDGFVTYKNE